MNTEELKRLAEAATPGPWFCDPFKWAATIVCGAGEEIDHVFIGGPICETRSPLGIPGADPRCEQLRKANAAYIAAANPAAVLELIQQRDELLAAMHRIRSTPPAQADGGGFVVDHFDIEGEYAGSQNIDPMWVVQEMAAVASAAIAKAEG